MTDPEPPTQVADHGLQPFAKTAARHVRWPLRSIFGPAHRTSQCVPLIFDDFRLNFRQFTHLMAFGPRIHPVQDSPTIPTDTRQAAHHLTVLIGWFQFAPPFPACRGRPPFFFSWVLSGCTALRTCGGSLEGGLDEFCQVLFTRSCSWATSLSNLPTCFCSCATCVFSSWFSSHNITTAACTLSGVCSQSSGGIGNPGGSFIALVYFVPCSLFTAFLRRFPDSLLLVCLLFYPSERLPKKFIPPGKIPRTQKVL
jgi:hypothetical protein